MFVCECRLVVVMDGMVRGELLFDASLRRLSCCFEWLWKGRCLEEHVD